MRYCDDFVLGFQYADDARRMLVDLKKRFERFGLRLHEDKTRLIEFGRLPALKLARRGKRPETFAFLGFVHYCGWTRDGWFVLKRKTQSKRTTRKLRELRQQARLRMHAPVAAQHRWLCHALRGHYAYYGLPSNFRSMSGFYMEVRHLWFRSLRRRGQRAHGWDWFAGLLEQFPLPRPQITRPYDALRHCQ